MKRIPQQVSIEEALADKMVRPLFFCYNEEWFIISPTHDDIGNFRARGKYNTFRSFFPPDIIMGIKNGTIEAYQLNPDVDPMHDITALIVKVRYER